MVNYRNWIFDWSGTLVDDLVPVIAGTNKVFSHYNKPLFSRQTFCEQFYLPYPDFYRQYLPAADKKTIEQLFREGFAPFAEQVFLFADSLNLLQSLREQQCRILICTSVAEDLFQQQITQLGVAHYFDEIHTNVMYKDQEVKNMLQQYQLSADETIFVGDMIHDMTAAKSANIAAIGLYQGYNSMAELATVSPDFLHASTSELYQCKGRYLNEK